MARAEAEVRLARWRAEQVKAIAEFHAMIDPRAEGM
jgi:hypothetical protein